MFSEPDPCDLAFSDGAYVIDARNVEPSEVIRAVIGGPMLATSFDSQSIQQVLCPEERYTGQTLNALTRVSVDVYLAFWRMLLYVRIGRVRNRMVVWEAF